MKEISRNSVNALAENTSKRKGAPLHDDVDSLLELAKDVKKNKQSKKVDQVEPQQDVDVMRPADSIFAAPGYEDDKDVDVVFDEGQHVQTSVPFRSIAHLVRSGHLADLIPLCGAVAHMVCVTLCELSFSFIHQFFASHKLSAG